MLVKTDVVETWLGEFNGDMAKEAYRSILRKHQRHVDVDLNSYLEQDRAFLSDFESFIVRLDNPPKTVVLYTSVIKESLGESTI